MSGCPTDEEWMEHLEGPPSPHLSKHIETCTGCRATVEAARAAHAALVNLSPAGRRLCPPPEELTAVPAGVAPAAVRLHVALCADCRDDLADLATLGEEPPRELVARWLAEGFRVVSQTISDLAPQPVPLAATRGGAPAAAGWRVIHALDEGQLSLELAPGVDRTFALSVAFAPPVPPGTRVELEAGGRLLESRALDAAGLHAFLSLEPGRYRLAVRRPHLPAVVTDLDVG